MTVKVNSVKLLNLLHSIIKYQFKHRLKSSHIKTIGIQTSHSCTMSSSTQVAFETRSCGSQTSHHHFCSSNEAESEYVHRNLLQSLNESQSLFKLSKLLKEHDQTDKFIKLIHALSNRKLNMNNISWKAALDMGALSMCASMTNMSYNKEWILPSIVPHVWWWCL